MKKSILALLVLAVSSSLAIAAFPKKSAYPQNFDASVNTKKETTNYVNFKKEKDGTRKTEYLCDKVISEEEFAKTAEATPKKLLVKPRKVRHFLVWDRTEGFRHTEGIPAMRAFLECLEKNSGGMWKMHFTDDRKEFETLENLKKYDCVIINNCTGRFFESYRYVREGKDGLGESAGGMTGEQKRADERMNYVCRDNLIKFVEEGGGIMGAHAACDAMDCKDRENPDEKFPAYPVMMGGRFAGHPWGAGNSAVTVLVEDKNSPILKNLWPEGEFKIQDEIYTFREEYGYDRKKQRILVSLDFDRSPKDGGQDPMKHTSRKTKDFGLAWVKKYGKGRIFYGAFGHRKDIYWRNPKLCEMYMRGLQFACGDLKMKDAQIFPIDPVTKKIIDPTK